MDSVPSDASLSDELIDLPAQMQRFDDWIPRTYEKEEQLFHQNPWLSALHQHHYSSVGQTHDDIIQTKPNLIFEGLPALHTRQSAWDAGRASSLVTVSWGLNSTQRQTLFTTFNLQQAMTFWLSMENARKKEWKRTLPSYSPKYLDVSLNSIKSTWYNTVETLHAFNVIKIYRRDHITQMPLCFTVVDPDICMNAFNIFFVLFTNEGIYNQNNWKTISDSLRSLWIHELGWGLHASQQQSLFREGSYFARKYYNNVGVDFFVPFPDSFQKDANFIFLPFASQSRTLRINFFQPKTRSIYYLMGDPTDIIRADVTYGFYSNNLLKGQHAMFMVLPWYTDNNEDQHDEVEVTGSPSSSLPPPPRIDSHDGSFHELEEGLFDDFDGLGPDGGEDKVLQIIEEMDRKKEGIKHTVMDDDGSFHEWGGLLDDFDDLDPDGNEDKVLHNIEEMDRKKEGTKHTVMDDDGSFHEWGGLLDEFDDLDPDGGEEKVSSFLKEWEDKNEKMKQ